MSIPPGRTVSESHAKTDTGIGSPNLLDFSNEAGRVDPSEESEPRYALGRAIEMESSGARWIFYALVGILGMTLFLIFTLVRTGVVAVSDVKEFGILLSPLVTLVAAAMGFYCGMVARTGRR